MARGMGLTLLLMASSMAAAVAAPGVIEPLTGWDCRTGSPAVRAPAGRQRPVAATQPVLPPSDDAGCETDPARVYRHWHHGDSKLGASCPPFTGPSGPSGATARGA